jgi:hypothetical protein
MDTPKIAEQINMPLTGSAQIVETAKALVDQPREEQRGITTMPTALVLLPPHITILVARAVEMAKGMVIESNEDYEASTLLLQTFLEVTAEKTGELDKVLNDNIKRWFEGHRAATKQKADLKAPFFTAREILEKKRRAYRGKVEEADRQRNAALQAAAKKQQDDAALEQAARLEELKEPEAAQAVFEMAARAPAPAVSNTYSMPKPKGETIKKIWRFKITHPELIQRQYLVPKDPFDVDSYPKIKDVVESLGKECGVTGIEVYEDEKDIVRRAKKG